MSSHKAVAETFLRLASSGDVRNAYSRHTGEGFRHHNAHFAGDGHALMAAMEENARQNPLKTCEIKQAIEEGDRVALLSHVRLKPGDSGIAVVHIFRFEHDRIVELWDIGQPIPQESPNQNGMF